MPRISDVSEACYPDLLDVISTELPGQSATRANSFVASFKRSGKMPAVVDFVASGSRFKILLPKQDVKLTLVLSGIQAPRTARNASERSEPFGPEVRFHRFFFSFSFACLIDQTKRLSSSCRAKHSNETPRSKLRPLIALEVRDMAYRDDRTCY